MPSAAAPDTPAWRHPAGAARETLVAELTARWRAAWARSDQLFSLLPDDGWLDRPIGLRHPFLFYLGHLPGFAWNHVGHVAGAERIDAALQALFERGIDPLSDAAAEAASMATSRWPPVEDVLAFRDAVRARLLESFDALDARAADTRDPLAVGYRVHLLALEHEAMHHETLLYMLHQQPLGRLVRPPLDVIAAPVLASAPGVERTRVTIPAGPTRLGAAFDEAAFGWDNEFEAERVDVPAFGLDTLPVTHADWQRFVSDGGYRTRSLWTEDGWAWRHARGVDRPVLWSDGQGADVTVRSLFARHPIGDVAAWPVQVSQAEAAAYARWASARLPTEAELHRAAYGDPDPSAGPDAALTRPFPWGDAEPTGAHGVFDFAGRRWSPSPVGAHPLGASAFGIHDLVGNGWEWTSTPFRPLPGFRPWIRTYAGYSADFFDDAHVVVFGASWATDRALLRRAFRNWYQPHYPFPFTKFRLAVTV